jgi:hypothetical protein
VRDVVECRPFPLMSASPVAYLPGLDLLSGGIRADRFAARVPSWPYKTCCRFFCHSYDYQPLTPTDREKVYTSLSPIVSGPVSAAVVISG